MTREFDSFVIFAEMRTGSNLLEDYLNQMDGVTCHGEAFNPAFIGYPNASDILGVTQRQREADPHALLNTIRRATVGLGGFRYFHDHDPRVLASILTDARCAKIVLSRNPLNSYVSLKIARATGQWKLTNVKNRKSATIRFEPSEFETHLATIQQFQRTVSRALQVTGQTAFHIAYDEINDTEVLTGLAEWLGVRVPETGFQSRLKPQNPQPLAEKVANFDEMTDALRGFDWFDMDRAPGFEPRRGPVVPSYVAGKDVPLLFMPIRSAPERTIIDWMQAQERRPDALLRKQSQSELRDWMASRPGFRSFSVLRHPLARAHHAFCEKILNTGPGGFARIRNRLMRFHDLDLPEMAEDPSYDRDAHRDAFEKFLRFLKANLSGQTGIRVDAHWASQWTTLNGMAEFCMPDHVFREEEIAGALPGLARDVGLGEVAGPSDERVEAPHALDAIYDGALESLCREIYPRDYLMFGFGAYR